MSDILKSQHGEAEALFFGAVCPVCPATHSDIRPAARNV